MTEFDPTAETYTHYSFYRPSGQLTGLYAIEPREIDRLRSYVHRLNRTNEGLRSIPRNVVVQCWADLVEYVKITRGKA